MMALSTIYAVCCSEAMNLDLSAILPCGFMTVDVMDVSTWMQSYRT